MDKITYANTTQNRLLRLVFADKDEIHLRPGEFLIVETKYKVVKVEHV